MGVKTNKMPKNKSNLTLASTKIEGLAQHESNIQTTRSASIKQPIRLDFLTKPKPYPKNGLYGLL
ncbi:MAG: hypothetical protein EOO07_02840 [Chitinophagaceae bacterium]|nr:MAG: hypothetical protein EOO07_02840 [Chitinophagaceae bacterium]